MATAALQKNVHAQIRRFSKSNELAGFAGRINADNCVEMDEGEPIQFCNLKENILRLEELAKKNGISLDDDQVDGHTLFQELFEVNPSATMRLAKRDSTGPTCWFNVGRRFSGLKPEHLPEENKLAQLESQFGLQHITELPDLPMDAISNCLLAR